MLTLSSIIREIKKIPEDKLEEVHRFIKSLEQNSKRKNSHIKDLMSYAGSWKDMSNEDYRDFVKETKRIRKNLFSRKFKV